MRRISGNGTLWPAAGLSLFFVYLELLKAHRSSQWAGVLPGDWIGIVSAGLMYAVALGIFLAAGQWLLERVASAVQAGGGVALAVAGGLVWALLSVHREFTPTSDDAIVAVVLLGTGAAQALSVGRRWLSLRAFGVLLLCTWLAGIAGLIAAGEYFLFAPDRAKAVTLFPLVWLGVSAAVLAGLVFFRHERFVLPAGLLLAMLPLVVVLGSLRAPAHTSAETGRPPNLVLFIADTLRADYCSAYGGQVPTPNLERLAAQGTRFDRHYALSPWTLPSITGLFSSQYPKSLTPDAGHEAWTLQMNQYEVDYEQPTFPMLLEEAGYATGAFTANAFLPAIPGMMFGYQERASSHPILLEDEGLFRQLPFLGALAQAWCPSLADIRPHNTTRDLDHYARAFIQRNRDRPFFLWVHYIDPHAPYDPPESLRRVPKGPWPFFHPYIGGEKWGIPILGKNFEVNPDDRDFVRSLYEGEVTYIDAFTGRVMDALAEAGVAEDTYFCFTSDHGEELWDHDQWGHGQSLYDELVRVPLVLSGPGIENRSEPSPVSAIDLIPTLADLVGIEPEPEWRGRSMAPVLRGEAGATLESPVFANGTSNKSSNPQQMVVVGDYKFIQTAGSEDVELYNLANDPMETKNIADAQPERVAAMAALVAEWMASYPSYFELDPDAAPEFNRALEQGLEGMGYL